MKTRALILAGIAALSVFGASAGAARQSNPLSCAAWNANHAYGQSTTLGGLQEMFVLGFVAALEEQWMADGTHQIPDRHFGIETTNAAVSLYCQQFPGGDLHVAARNAAETLYPKKR